MRTYRGLAEQPKMVSPLRRSSLFERVWPSVFLAITVVATVTWLGIIAYGLLWLFF